MGLPAVGAIGSLDESSEHAALPRSTAGSDHRISMSGSATRVPVLTSDRRQVRLPNPTCHLLVQESERSGGPSRPTPTPLTCRDA
jgi:hypothetical protein